MVKRLRFCHRRFSRETCRYMPARCGSSNEHCDGADDVSANVYCFSPMGTMSNSIEELERQFLMKYEPTLCEPNIGLTEFCSPSNPNIGTTCAVGDTDPSKRYRTRTSYRCSRGESPAKGTQTYPWRSAQNSPQRNSQDCPGRSTQSSPRRSYRGCDEFNLHECPSNGPMSPGTPPPCPALQSVPLCPRPAPLPDLQSVLFGPKPPPCPALQSVPFCPKLPLLRDAISVFSSSRSPRPSKSRNVSADSKSQSSSKKSPYFPKPGTSKQKKLSLKNEKSFNKDTENQPSQVSSGKKCKKSEACALRVKQATKSPRQQTGSARSSLIESPRSGQRSPRSGQGSPRSRKKAKKKEKKNKEDLLSEGSFSWLSPESCACSDENLQNQGSPSSNKSPEIKEEPRKDSVCSPCFGSGIYYDEDLVNQGSPRSKKSPKTKDKSLKDGACSPCFGSGVYCAEDVLNQGSPNSVKPGQGSPRSSKTKEDILKDSLRSPSSEDCICSEEDLKQNSPRSRKSNQGSPKKKSDKRKDSFRSPSVDSCECSDEELLNQGSPRSKSGQGSPRSGKSPRKKEENPKSCLRPSSPDYDMNLVFTEEEVLRKLKEKMRKCTDASCPAKNPHRRPCEDDDAPCRRSGGLKPCLVKSPAIERPPSGLPFVTATLKDIVTKIASLAMPETTEPASPCGRDDCRSVRFSDVGTTATCTQNVEEIFFNRQLNKSDASVDWVQCVNEECLRENASPTCTNIKECQAATKKSQESGAGSSLVSPCDSAGSCSGTGGGKGSSPTCEAARAQYYHSKLLATLQILQNKDETCRLQGESLAVAEARIANLTFRAEQMKNDLAQKSKEICQLRCALDSSDQSKTTKSDVSVQMQDAQAQGSMSVVKTLQDNLSIIEELYRECFYETAKQEALIETLRKSYLDVRLAEKQKVDQIDQLRTTVHRQKRSLDQCQDIAAEVESLKLEINNFMTHSNNDSGMWEREESLAAEVGGELSAIMEQLHALRGVLAGDCSCDCDLATETERLRETVGQLESQIGDYQRRLCGVECALKSKEEAIKKYKKYLDEKEEELENAQQQIADLAEKEKSHSGRCSCLQQELESTQAVLSERNAELCAAQNSCAERDVTIADLRKQLEKADAIIKENSKVRSEVSYLTQQVGLWRRQLGESEARAACVDRQLRKANERAVTLDANYRQQVSAALALQEQLETAHARGAQLCAEARHVVQDARRWVKRMKHKQMEQEETIRQQAATIASLRQKLETQERTRPCARLTPAPAPAAGAAVGVGVGVGEDSWASAPAKLLAHATQLLAGQIGRASGGRDEMELPCSSHTNKTSETMTPCCCRARELQGSEDRASAATSTASPPGPGAPAGERGRRRLLKRTMCDNMRCAVRVRELSCPDGEASGRAGAGRGHDVIVDDSCTYRRCARQGSMSPTDELLQRAARLQGSLEAEGQRLCQRQTRP